MEIKKVGVVGCGLMGSGIAEVAARSGYEVLVSEANPQLLDRGLKAIQGSLRRAQERGKATPEEVKSTLDRVRGTAELGDFRDRDLVIEAITENLELKKQVFARLDQVCPPGAILASNTSCLSVTALAMATKRPSQVVGLHFFNPAPVMKLVELVKTILVSPQTLDAARSFARSLGKTVVEAPDSPGFIVNRLLTPFMLEAMRLYEGGAVTREDMDQGVVLGLNHPMGPLALADLVGLDTLLFVADAIYEEFRDPRFAAPLLLRRMVTAGYLGRKSGRGFYEYK